MALGVRIQDLPCSFYDVRFENHRSTPHRFDVSRDTHDLMTVTEGHAFTRLLARRSRGDFDPALPTPSERQRIRLEAGLTQRDVADVLMVSRHTVARWERLPGRIGDRRLPGREPSGDLRRQYATLLSRLESLATRR